MNSYCPMCRVEYNHIYDHSVRKFNIDIALSFQYLFAKMCRAVGQPINVDVYYIDYEQEFDSSYKEISDFFGAVFSFIAHAKS